MPGLNRAEGAPEREAAACPEAAREHPCFSHQAHGRYGRIHLPVAPRCNIQCAYCDRRYDCASESRPGVTSAVITPEEAVKRTEEALKREPRIRVAGIAGPGEPLYNPETFETLRLLGRRFPGLTLCISTNGLLLPEKAAVLKELGVATLTVTVNAVTEKTASGLYTRVESGCSGEALREGIARLLRAQQRGLAEAVRAGLCVKVNTVLVPGINEAEVDKIAVMAAKAGAAVMNIMPLIPCGRLIGHPSPAPEATARARQRAGAFIPQFTQCRQCRADACGIPGRELSF